MYIIHIYPVAVTTWGRFCSIKLFHEYSSNVVSTIIHKRRRMLCDHRHTVACISSYSVGGGVQSSGKGKARWHRQTKLTVPFPQHLRKFRAGLRLKPVIQILVEVSALRLRRWHVMLPRLSPVVVILKVYFPRTCLGLSLRQLWTCSQINAMIYCRWVINHYLS